MVVVLVVDWGSGGVVWRLDDEGGWVIRARDGLGGLDCDKGSTQPTPG